MSSVPPRPKLKLAESNPSDAPAPKPVAMRAQRPDAEAPAKVAEKKRGRLAMLFPADAPKKDANMIHVEATLDPSRTMISKAGQQPTVTQPSKLHARSRAVPVRAGAKDANDDSQTRTVLIVVAALALTAGALSFAFRGHGGSKADAPSGTSVMSAPEMQSRVDYHRNTIGRRLNRERIGVEYENEKNAPVIAPDAAKVSGSNMMSGLPLVGERPPTSYRDSGSTSADPDYADSRTEYSLKEQENVDALEKQQRAEYVHDFIANAAKAGLRVKVDANGQVTVVGRAPAAGAPASSNSNGEALPR